MQGTPEPQDAARAAGSADFTHYGDYLGYAGDLGYENHVAADEPSAESANTTADTDTDSTGDSDVADTATAEAAQTATAAAAQASEPAGQDGRHPSPPSPRAAADDAIGTQSRHAATTA